MKSSLAQKDTGVLVDKAAMSQRCALRTNKANFILGCASKGANIAERDSFHLPAVCETTSGVLCVVLGLTIRETVIYWSKSRIMGTNLITRLG